MRKAARDGFKLTIKWGRPMNWSRTQRKLKKDEHETRKKIFKNF